MAVCWLSESAIAVATQWELYIVDLRLNEVLQSFDIRIRYYPPVCQQSQNHTFTRRNVSCRDWRLF